jgi:hypothetical protein
MPNRLALLALSDPRGDLDLVAKTISLAHSKDVNAQAIFFLGNFAGPLLSKPELYMLDGARRTLDLELKSHEHTYRKDNVTTLTQLLHFIEANPDRFRRSSETNAVRTIHTLLGRRDEHGKFVEYGIAAKKARAVYATAAKLFSKSRIPCHVMADTVLTEEVIPEQHWLHFSWVSVGGFSVRCLGASELEDADAIPEYFPGPRRGGKLVRIENYPISGADIIFAYVLNPVLHELLSTAERKLVVMCGNGQIDTGYPKNIVSTQRAHTAYLYTIDGTKVVRRMHEYENAAFKASTLDDPGGDTSSTTRFNRRAVRRAEIETQVRLAGLAKDLVLFTDLLRKENPDLAAQIEKSENRADALFRYVQFLEHHRVALRQALSAERAGLERLVNKVTPYFSEEQVAKVNDLLKRRPEPTSPVEELDAANEAIAAMLSAFLAARLASPPRVEGEPGPVTSDVKPT